MKYNAHEYQEYCINYILKNKIAAIFLDCGLGKTSITLSAINELMYNRFEISKVLVVAPLRVAKLSWPDEIEKFDDFKNLSYSLVVGSLKARKEALEKEADIYIINRENLQWLIEKSGKAFDYDMVVLDELSSFKNWNSKRVKAFMKVRPKVKRVVGLTGTPSPNGLMDLFSQIKCLDMGERLGRFISQYRINYFRPGRMNGPIVYEYIPLKDAERRIYDKISDITISMRAMDHLKMPKLINTRYPVYMDGLEDELYEEMKEGFVLKYIDGREVTASNAAVLSGKLCQLSNGAIYTEDKEIIKIHDKKLDALEDIIESANGKPVLVAYWFAHDLERIEERLNKEKIPYERLKSDESIRRWNAGDVPVGLIHPASAGHGLNLQKGGNHLVWFGLTWSLELYQQTVARLYRQGQEEQTVVVQHIVNADTIDEDILEALTHKENTQNALIDAVKAKLQPKHGGLK